jgi:sigma-54 dependent transcriptional regulator, acetoin dehydrogenase operon transcriptional activator AcoR
MSAPSKILFICSDNTSRSQMAEGLARELGGDRVDAYSAGITADGVHPLAIKVMAEIDIPIANQTSRTIADLPTSDFDLVITLCNDALTACFDRETLPADDRKRLLGGVPDYLHWPIADPAVTATSKDEAIDAFRHTRIRIRARVAALIDDGYLEALRSQRDRLQRFADLLDEGILIHDDQRNIYLVNEAFLQISGYTREEVIGRDCHDIFNPHGLCGGDCQFCAATSRPSGRETYRIPLITADGANKQLRMTTEPMQLEPGRMGMMAVLYDETAVRDLRAELTEKRRFHGMVGSSRAAREVYAAIESVSVSDYPVLVSGESGTGKELVAGAIHNESARRAGAFVPVNCGAIPENIVESELFGHVRGAFTGAIRDKKGRFELAHGGTLFLDEVGELPKAIQAKLLRVLETKSFTRVGDEREITVDIRIISATNRDLRQMVRDGRFREDLFYRLCVVPLNLPPLRERREDIPLLIEHALEMIAKETDRETMRVGGPTLDTLTAYAWPGNIRELINAMQYASLRCREDEIRTEHLPPEVRQELDRVEPVAMPDPGSRRFKLTPAAVARALTRAGGNKAQAARLLNVGRATLYRFLERQKEENRP